MSILLTHGYFLHEDPKEQEIMKPYPPLGILYLSSWLKRNRLKCSVFDSTFSTKEKLLEHLISNKPKYLCMYVNLMTKVNVVDVIKKVRAHPEIKNTWIILGGPEVTHHAEKFLDAGADFIVVGEGEETLTELITTLDVPFNPFVDQVKGIVFRNAVGKIVRTAEREKIKDIDNLPFPDREAIDLGKYLDAWKQRHGQNAISVSTMRGCPYTCKWCSRAVYGLSYRRRSPDWVVRELKSLVETYHPDTFWFVDDVFTVSHVWLREFAEALKKENLKIKYECITRADRMNEEVVQLLKESGCFRVWIGAESGSQKVIDLMDRRVEVKTVRDMIQLAQANGIEAGTFIMVGYPGETKADIEETVRHLVESNPDHFTLTVAYPIKGTPFYAEVAETITDEGDWETTTDRQIKFKRPYTDAFYQNAIRYIYNEVWYRKSLKGKNKNLLRAIRYKLRSIAAKFRMRG